MDNFEIEFSSLVCIRKRIEVLYLKYCDLDGYGDNEIIQAVRKPKMVFMEYLEKRNNDGKNFDEIAEQEIIHKVFDEQEELLKRTKQRMLNRKIKISRSDFEKYVGLVIRRAWDSYDIGYKNKDTIALFYEPQEDNLSVKYICKSLMYAMMKLYYKEHGIKHKRFMRIDLCECGRPFNQNKRNNRSLCEACRKKHKAELDRMYYQNVKKYSDKVKKRIN